MASQKQAHGARVIESFESVPQIYQEFFTQHLSSGDVFPYTILTRRYEGSDHTVTEKLVCVIEHAFYVLEEKDKQLTKLCYPIDELNYVEVTHRPSDLHIRINGFTNLGRLATSVLVCNKSTENFLAPLFQRIRLRIDSLNEKAPSRHLERLDRWKDLQTGVIDTARHCLMAGEKVIMSVLQPEIRPSIFSPDRAFRGAKCATHICILTDKELVLIREDLSLGKKDHGNSVCHFIPVNKIHSLVVTRKSDKLLALAIRIANSETFESLFDVSLEHEVSQFMDRTRELMPKERLYIRD